MFSNLITQWLVMRSRESRRHSPWNLLLAPLTVVWFVVFAYTFLYGLGRLHAIVSPDVPPELFSTSLSGILVGVGVAIAALTPAFLMANCTVWLLPRARHAMDAESRKHPGTGFRESSIGLLKSAGILVPLGLVVACIALFII